MKWSKWRPCKEYDVLYFDSAHLEESNYEDDNVFLLGSLPSSSFTASSYLNSTTQAQHSPEFKARNLGWFAKDNDNKQWIQVDLLYPRFIAEIKLASAKNDKDARVVAFKLFGGLYTEDLMRFTQMDLEGPNSDKRVTFRKLMFVRIIRLEPAKWANQIAMRWEFVQASSKCDNLLNFVPIE